MELLAISPVGVLALVVLVVQLRAAVRASDRAHAAAPTTHPTHQTLTTL